MKTIELTEEASELLIRVIESATDDTTKAYVARVISKEQAADTMTILLEIKLRLQGKIK